MTIETITSIARRELDQRVNGGLEITLYWNAYDNSTSVEIYHHETGETIGFPVPADQAPSVCLSRRRCSGLRNKL